jgi:hypothetical protein
LSLCHYLKFRVDKTVIDLFAAAGKVEQFIHPDASVQRLGGGHLAHTLELHPAQSSKSKFKQLFFFVIFVQKSSNYHDLLFRGKSNLLHNEAAC